MILFFTAKVVFDRCRVISKEYHCWVSISTQYWWLEDLNLELMGESKSVLNSEIFLEILNKIFWFLNALLKLDMSSVIVFCFKIIGGKTSMRLISKQRSWQILRQDFFFKIVKKNSKIYQNRWIVVWFTLVCGLQQIKLLKIFKQVLLFS